MFAWWGDFNKPTRYAWSNWWWTFFDGHHNPKRCWMPSISGQFCTRMHNNIVNPVMFTNEPKIFTYPNSEVDHHAPNWTIHEMGFGLHWPN
jgi:hypothetical protein